VSGLLVAMTLVILAVISARSLGAFRSPACRTPAPTSLDGQPPKGRQPTGNVIVDLLDLRAGPKALLDVAFGWHDPKLPLRLDPGYPLDLLEVVSLGRVDGPGGYTGFLEHLIDTKPRGPRTFDHFVETISVRVRNHYAYVDVTHA
jgi:hypothetical protein